jgi:hypothetical protein
MEERTLQEKERIRVADASEASIRKHSPAKPTAHSMEELKEMKSSKAMPTSGVDHGPAQPDGTNMSFGQALYYLDKGLLLQRKEWSDKGMFIYKTVGNRVPKDFIPKFASLPQSVKDYLAYRGEDVIFNSSLTLLTKTGEMQPGWAPFQTDMAANDWQIVTPIK